jgi:hypothetical protein
MKASFILFRLVSAETAAYLGHNMTKNEKNAQFKIHILLVLPASTLRHKITSIIGQTTNEVAHKVHGNLPHKRVYKGL